MIVGIVCHVEVLKLNHEAIVWQIILPDYYSYATKLIFGGAYIRTSSETQGQSVGPGEKARQKFSSMLENFCRTFSPFPTDCPWVSKDDIRREICPPPNNFDRHVQRPWAPGGHVLHATLLFICPFPFDKA